jgi:hypothetical protein
MPNTGMESLELSLGPLWTAKRAAKRARGRRRHMAGSAVVSIVERERATERQRDSPTARYQRWQPRETETQRETEDVSDPPGSERESPIDEAPLSPERDRETQRQSREAHDGSDPPVLKKQSPIDEAPLSPERDSEKQRQSRETETEGDSEKYEDASASYVTKGEADMAQHTTVGATADAAGGVTIKAQAAGTAHPEPEPLESTDTACGATNTAQDPDKVGRSVRAQPSNDAHVAEPRDVDSDAARLCTQPAGRQPLCARPQTSPSQGGVQVRPWDRAWSLPKRTTQTHHMIDPPPESTAGLGSATILNANGQMRLSPRQRRKQQRRLHASKVLQSLQPSPVKPVEVSQHGERLGIPKHVCEDCKLLRPVFGVEGTTEWRNSRWCEDCAKRSHPNAVPTHPFAEGWTYSVNGAGGTAGTRTHWSWNWEGRGKPLEAPSFTHFRTVSEVQDLAKKLSGSEWPKNGWTATNYAKRDRREDPHPPLEAPRAERDRAYLGDWTSSERERQFVQAKLCTPPRGLPHVEGCTVSGCRGECLYVPQYHKPLPGGSGGPRSLQKPQERVGDCPVYIPATQTAIVDDAAMPLTHKSDEERTPMKRPSWEETKKNRERLQRREAESARLLAERRVSATPPGSRFSPPHTYSAQLTVEVGNINASMPQNTCPSRCMVEGMCLCSARDRSESERVC